MPGFEGLSTGTIVWIAAIMALAGVMQGALGLGFPTVATPLIALAADMRTAILLVLLPCLATVALNLFRGGPVRPVLARFWTMPCYMLLGAAAGTRLFVAYPEFPYALLLAAIILLYLNLDRLGRTEWPLVARHAGLSAAVFGLAAGLSEGTANVASPPLIVYYLAIGTSPLVLVQALNLCFWREVHAVSDARNRGRSGAGPMAGHAAACSHRGAGHTRGIRIRDRIDAATYRRWLKGALLVNGRPAGRAAGWSRG